MIPVPVLRGKRGRAYEQPRIAGPPGRPYLVADR